MLKKMWCLLAVLLFGSGVWVHAQTVDVTGRVTDERGQPIANASVIIKGTQRGTTTNEDGRFSLPIPAGGPTTLSISSIGYVTQDVTTTGSSFVVALTGNTGTSEVVITALGVRKEKRALGYATQEVNSETLVEAKQPNLLNALQGKVAGVQINSTGGAPGQGASILIRGIKSLDPGKSNQPLFVIDGVVMDNSTQTVSTQGSLRGMSNRAADINPDDVETISILRGGAATALYGQAGSNGVVLITTKSGKAGKLKVTLNTSYGIDEVNKFPEVQMKYTQGYLGEYDPISFWPSWGPTVEAARAIDATHPSEIYDHYAQGYRRGNQTRTSIGIAGGTERAMLSSNISYFKQNGTIPFTDYQNISARLSTTFKISDKLSFIPTVMYIRSGGLRYNADRYNESLTYWSPRWNVMDYINPDGTMKSYGNNNPVYGAATNQFRDNVNRILANGAISYEPLKWLRFDYRLGLDFYTDFRRHTAPGPLGTVDEIRYEDNGLGFVNEYRIENRIANSNLMATLTHDWSEKFNTTLRLGNDVRDQHYSRLSAEGSELDIPSLLSLNNTKIRTASQYMENYRIVSAFGELSLDFDNKIFLSVTGRNDWSSALAPGLNSYFYPSVSLSAVVSDMVTLPSAISFAKLRGSWAEIGKDTDPYRINTYFGSSILTSTGQVLWSRSTQRGEATLRPERTATLELGAELQFLRNRLGLDFTWYKLNSRDQIIPVAISPTSGFSTLITNAGEIENRGVEISLNATPIRSEDFEWEIGANYTRNRNKVLSIREGLTEIVLGSQYGYANSTVTMKYVPGDPVGNLYGSSQLRYYGSKTDDKTTIDHSLPLVIAATGSNRGFPVRDGTQRIVGNAMPDWIGGLRNSFRYKDITLSFSFDAQIGMEKYNQLSNFMTAFGISKFWEGRDEFVVFDGVLPDGTPNSQSVYMGQGVASDGRDYGAGYARNVYRGVSEHFVEDASWVRLRNLSLGYRIPETVFSNSFIEGITVSLTGNNLWLWTPFTGFDPESSSYSAGSNMGAGFAGFTYPAMRSYIASLQVNFK